MSGTASANREELPCIWVLAGVLSYRLCDRGYDCEHCELFHALQGCGDPTALAASSAAASEVAAADSQINPYLWRLLEGCELHLDRPYSTGHAWLREERDGAVAVGLDGHVLRILRPMDDVVVPRVGAWLKRGEACGWIMRGEMAIPLAAPLSGEVTAVNDSYRSALRRGAASGDGDRWLFRLAAHEALDQVSGLLRGERTLLWFVEKIRLLKQYLREAVEPGVPDVLGATMNDGGVPASVESVLGRERFEALVEELFRVQL